MCYYFQTQHNLIWQCDEEHIFKNKVADIKQKSCYTNCILNFFSFSRHLMQNIYQRLALNCFKLLNHLLILRRIFWANTEYRRKCHIQHGPSFPCHTSVRREGRTLRSAPSERQHAVASTHRCPPRWCPRQPAAGCCNTYTSMNEWMNV